MDPHSQHDEQHGLGALVSATSPSSTGLVTQQSAKSLYESKFGRAYADYDPQKPAPRPVTSEYLKRNLNREDLMRMFQHSVFALQLPALLARKLAQVMRLRRFDPNSVIYRQGDLRSDVFYVVVHGTVAVFREETGKQPQEHTAASSARGDPYRGESEGRKTLRFLSTLKTGDSFGYRNFLSGAERDTTVLAVDDTLLACLHRTDYDKAVKEAFPVPATPASWFKRKLGGLLTMEDRQVIAPFVRDRLFLQLSPRDVAEVVESLMPETHPLGTIVCEEADVAESCYVVLSGSLSVHKVADEADLQTGEFSSDARSLLRMGKMHRNLKVGDFFGYGKEWNTLIGEGGATTTVKRADGRRTVATAPKSRALEMHRPSSVQFKGIPPPSASPTPFARPTNTGVGRMHSVSPSVSAASRVGALMKSPFSDAEASAGDNGLQSIAIRKCSVLTRETVLLGRISLVRMKTILADAQRSPIPHIDKISAILRVEPARRSNDMITKLCKAFRDLNFFKHMQREMLRKCCRALRCVTADEGKIIYKQGADSTEASVQILLQGSVAVMHSIQGEEEEKRRLYDEMRSHRGSLAGSLNVSDVHIGDSTFLTTGDEGSTTQSNLMLSKKTPVQRGANGRKVLMRRETAGTAADLNNPLFQLKRSDEVHSEEDIRELGTCQELLSTYSVLGEEVLSGNKTFSNSYVARVPCVLASLSVLEHARIADEHKVHVFNGVLYADELSKTMAEIEANKASIESLKVGHSALPTQIFSEEQFEFLNQQIAQIAFFKKFHVPMRRYLVGNMCVRAFKPNEILYKEGDVADSIFIIIKGQVSLHKRNEMSLTIKGWVDRARVKIRAKALEKPLYAEDSSHTRTPEHGRRNKRGSKRLSGKKASLRFASPGMLALASPDMPTDLHINSSMMVSSPLNSTTPFSPLGRRASGKMLVSPGTSPMAGGGSFGMGFARNPRRASLMKTENMRQADAMQTRLDRVTSHVDEGAAEQAAKADMRAKRRRTASRSDLLGILPSPIHSGRAMLDDSDSRPASSAGMGGSHSSPFLSREREGKIDLNAVASDSEGVNTTNKGGDSSTLATAHDDNSDASGMPGVGSVVGSAKKKMSREARMTKIMAKHRMVNHLKAKKIKLSGNGSIMERVSGGKHGSSKNHRKTKRVKMAGHTAIKAHAVLEMFSDMFKSERQKKNDRETGVKVVYGPNEQDLGVGNSFGEIGLMSDNKRVRTVVAKEDCVMFEIKKDVYLRTVRNRKQLRDVHTVVSSLKAVRDLHGLSFALLDDLARSVDVRTFHRNEEVSSQGDGGNFVYCLIQGSVKAVRYYNVKQTPITDSKRTSAKQSHILSAQQLNERHVLLEAFNSNITRVLGEEDSMSEYAKEQKRNKASIVEAQLAQYHQGDLFGGRMDMEKTNVESQLKMLGYFQGKEVDKLLVLAPELEHYSSSYDPLRTKVDDVLQKVSGRFSDSAQKEKDVGSFSRHPKFNKLPVLHAYVAVNNVTVFAIKKNSLFGVLPPPMLYQLCKTAFVRDVFNNMRQEHFFTARGLVTPIPRDNLLEKAEVLPKDPGPLHENVPLLSAMRAQKIWRPAVVPIGVPGASKPNASIGAFHTQIQRLLVLSDRLVGASADESKHLLSFGVKSLLKHDLTLKERLRESESRLSRDGISDSVMDMSSEQVSRGRELLSSATSSMRSCSSSGGLPIVTRDSLRGEPQSFQEKKNKLIDSRNLWAKHEDEERDGHVSEDSEWEGEEAEKGKKSAASAENRLLGIGGWKFATAGEGDRDDENGEMALIEGIHGRVTDSAASSLELTNRIKTMNRGSGSGSGSGSGRSARHKKRRAPPAVQGARQWLSQRSVLSTHRLAVLRKLMDMDFPNTNAFNFNDKDPLYRPVKRMGSSNAIVMAGVARKKKPRLHQKNSAIVRFTEENRMQLRKSHSMPNMPVVTGNSKYLQNEALVEAAKLDKSISMRKNPMTNRNHTLRALRVQMRKVDSVRRGRVRAQQHIEENNSFLALIPRSMSASSLHTAPSDALETFNSRMGRTSSGLSSSRRSSAGDDGMDVDPPIASNQFSLSLEGLRAR